MGRYVYLEDEEIQDYKLLLAAYPNEEHKKTFDKLTQQPKTLEDLHFIDDKENTYGDIVGKYDTENERNIYFAKDTSIIGLDNDQFCNEYTIEELEAILNKAHELFKEEE